MQLPFPQDEVQAMNTPDHNYTPLPGTPQGWIWFDNELVPVNRLPREAWLVSGGEVLDRERKVSEATKGAK